MNPRISIIDGGIRATEWVWSRLRLLPLYRSALDGAGDQPLTIIDVGGHRGQSVELFMKLDRPVKIYTFEPTPHLFKRLQARYMQLENIRVEPYGISEKSGERIFYANVLDSTSSLKELDFNSSYLHMKSRVLGVRPEELVADSYPIMTYSLTDYIALHGIERIDWLKLDVEGYEYGCLLGLEEALKRGFPVDYIQLESHDDEMYLEPDNRKIHDFLTRYGYEVVSRIRHYFGNFFEMIYRRSRD